ncbi:LOW QUALITY PROTEIN: cystatin-M [Choloepus didactylus]|uniref:LOW QUALITY PROTEIN: cystatin-M n=1 Tax=Choloepus didactylus TaxID=27675 RepID=UPI00189DFDDB|nr:LOW QUALITY PROTEIN: cystatin-M [Choloepus didactylus]
MTAQARALGGLGPLPPDPAPDAGSRGARRGRRAGPAGQVKSGAGARIGAPHHGASSLPVAAGSGPGRDCLLALPLTSRDRPEHVMTGEPRDLSPRRPQVQKVVQEAVESYNKRSNSLYFFRHTRVLKARGKLVAGVLYYLSVEMENTDCQKNNANVYDMDLTTCPLTVGAEQQKLHCDFEVLSVPWKNTTTLEKQHCTPV